MGKKIILSEIKVMLLSSILIFAYKPFPAEIPTAPPTAVSSPSGIVFTCASDDLWSYLRLGLTYLESPKPLLPPEAVSPQYIHPDSRGFGAYGFSPEAYSDVQRLYPFFKDRSWEEILNSPRLYDLANQAFADNLLKNLKEFIPQGASKEETFKVLHQAWNLGLSGFKKGRQVVQSRSRRAGEFLQMAAVQNS